VTAAQKLHYGLCMLGLFAEAPKMRLRGIRWERRMTAGDVGADDMADLAADEFAPETTAPAPRAPSNLIVWGTIALLAACFALAIIDRSIGTLLIKPIKADLGLSDTAFGIAQGSAIGLFYVLFAIPFGWASDRFDRRKILCLGLVVWSLASASTALVGSFAGLFAARAMVGAGEAALGPTGYPLIARSVPPHRMALAVTIFVLGATSGNGLAFIIGGILTNLMSDGPRQVWLLGDLAPWRITFLATGLPGLVLAGLVLFIPRPQAQMAGDAPRSPDAPAALTTGFGKYLCAHYKFYAAHNIGMGAQQAAIGAAIGWNVAFMSRVYGWEAGRVGLVFGPILLLTSGASVLFHGWMVNRLFRAGQTDAHFRWQAGMSILSLPLFAAGFLLQDFWVTSICVGLLSFCLSSTLVSGPTSLQLATPERLRGRATALYVMAATTLGAAIGPALVGVLTDYFFKDEKLVGWSITMVGIGASAITIYAFTAGRGAMRRAIAAASQS
jgi:MFS family permease